MGGGEKDFLYYVSIFLAIWLDLNTLLEGNCYIYKINNTKAGAWQSTFLASMRS
jgi:hypothetical protein